MRLLFVLFAIGFLAVLVVKTAVPVGVARALRKAEQRNALLKPKVFCSVSYDGMRCSTLRGSNHR